MFLHGISAVYKLQTPDYYQNKRILCQITLAERLPLSIFSKPTANTHSCFPDSTNSLASNKAVEPVEQLLLTLKIGIPVIPTS
jgi:hypothetical protein